MLRCAPARWCATRMHFYTPRYASVCVPVCTHIRVCVYVYTHACQDACVCAYPRVHAWRTRLCACTCVPVGEHVVQPATTRGRAQSCIWEPGRGAFLTKVGGNGKKTHRRKRQGRGRGGTQCVPWAGTGLARPGRPGGCRPGPLRFLFLRESIFLRLHGGHPCLFHQVPSGVLLRGRGWWAGPTGIPGKRR